MKRMLCLMVGLLLCLSMALPALAAEKGFVPSITYKPGPAIVPAKGPDGKAYMGLIRDSAGNILGYVEEGCLVITPVASLWDPEAEVPQHVAQLLQFVYEQLKSNAMQLPYHKHEAELDPADMVIRDLFDIRWTCEEHRDMLAAEGATLELTFDMGVSAQDRLFAMSYDEETGEWYPIVKTLNNGDCTVTCTFAHLCAVEISMPLNAAATPVDDVPRTNALPWIGLLAVSAAAALGIVIGKKRKK